MAVSNGFWPLNSSVESLVLRGVVPTTSHQSPAKQPRRGGVFPAPRNGPSGPMEYAVDVREALRSHGSWIASTSTGALCMARRRALVFPRSYRPSLYRLSALIFHLFIRSYFGCPLCLTTSPPTSAPPLSLSLPSLADTKPAM
jgi:hypothetical protein